jgi:hypothetical protein
MLAQAMRRGVSIGIMTTLLAVAATAAMGAAPLAPASKANRAAAGADANHELAELSLPLGATEIASDQSTKRVLTRYPPFGPGQASSDLVDDHRYWRVPGSPQSVVNWISAHAPAGSSSSGFTLYGLPFSTPQVSYNAFGFASSAGHVEDRTLAVEVTSAVGGGSAVRADGEAVWTLTRPAWERIPSDARSVTVRATQGPRISSLPVTLTAPAKLAAIARLLDRLPVRQPAASACPGDDGVGLELSFRAAANSRPVARVDADPEGCEGIGFSIGKRAGPGLAGGGELADLLGRLGGMVFCSASELHASSSEPGRAGPGLGYLTLLRFHNRSTSICSVIGFPQLAARNAAGAPLREHVTHDGPREDLATIPPGESATVFVSWSRSCPRDRVASLSVKLDRVPLAFAIPIGSATHPLDPCGGALTLSALSGP